MKRMLLLAMICLSTILPGQNDQFFQKVDSLVQCQQFGEATTLLYQFIEDHPGRYFNHAKAYLLISKNDLKQGDVEAAIANNKKSMTLRERLLTDDVAENYLQLGAIYNKKQEYDQALSYLRKAKSLPLEDPQVLAQVNRLLASVLVEKGAVEEAIQYLEQAIKVLEIELGALHPDVGATCLQLGQTYHTAGNTDQAELHFKKGLAIKSLRCDTYIKQMIPNGFFITILQRLFRLHE